METAMLLNDDGGNELTRIAPPPRTSQQIGILEFIRHEADIRKMFQNCHHIPRYNLHPSLQLTRTNAFLTPGEAE